MERDVSYLNTGFRRHECLCQLVGSWVLCGHPEEVLCLSLAMFPGLALHLSNQRIDKVVSSGYGNLPKGGAYGLHPNYGRKL